jgi:hypothetical protein
VLLLLSESRAIINDLGVILHGFMLQIIYTNLRFASSYNDAKLKHFCNLFDKFKLLFILRIYLNPTTFYPHPCKPHCVQNQCHLKYTLPNIYIIVFRASCTGLLGRNEIVYYNLQTDLSCAGLLGAYIDSFTPNS